MVYNWLKNIPWVLYPATCVACGQAPLARTWQRDLCEACHAALPWRRGPVCAQCGTALAGGEALHCGSCLAAPPAYDRVFAPLGYASPVGALVTGFKFHGRLAYGRVLGELLTEALASAQAAGALVLPAALVPVPLHRARLAGRGFNQALELARPVGRRLGLPILARGIRRRQDTPAQSTLDARARRANVRGAFAVERPVPARVAIVDDVVTTGATVDALARALRQAGAREVQVWALARA